MKGESVNILSQTLRTGDRIIGVCSGSSGNSSMTLGASFPCLFYTVKQRFSETLGALQLWGSVASRVDTAVFSWIPMSGTAVGPSWDPHCGPEE